MSLQSSITQVILEVGITTISELAKNIVYFILIYWGIKKITKEMPKWIQTYHKNEMEKYRIEKAIEGRKL
jgi:hypothetical protein